MSYGLRVWNGAGQLRLDTNDRTMRLTGKVYIPARSGVAAQTESSQFIAIPGFDPAIDGAFLTGAEPGYLGYDADEPADGFLPEAHPTVGGVYIIWRGYWGKYSRDIRYMACYLMVLRAD